MNEMAGKGSLLLLIGSELVWHDMIFTRKISEVLLILILSKSSAFADF